jgi:hypothetical protein
MDMTARLEALAAAPKPWLVSVVYEDGRVRTIRQPLEKQAINIAERESARIGKTLIDRNTGLGTRIASVTIEYAPQ